MLGSGGLIKSFSDMELNLMDEVAKRSGDADATSSNGDGTPATTAARSPEQWHEPARLPGAPPQKSFAPKLKGLFAWRGSQGKYKLSSGLEDREPMQSSEPVAEEESTRLLPSNGMDIKSDEEPVAERSSASDVGDTRRSYARATLRFLLSNWYKFVILGVIIALIVIISVKGFSVFGSILRWFQARNNWGGWGIFLGMYTAVVALFLPGVLLIMGAGFVFGFWKGLLAVWVGGAIGQALAFLLARYLLRDWVETTLQGKWRKWGLINRAIAHDGWKLVLIMRMSPIIPYNLLNIAMATTSMPFWQFTLVSAVGIIFECAIFCYIGSVASSITSILSGDAKGSIVELVLLGLSLCMGVMGAIFVSYSLKSAIKRADEAEASLHAGSTPAAAGFTTAASSSPTRPPRSGPPMPRFSPRRPSLVPVSRVGSGSVPDGMPVPFHSPVAPRGLSRGETGQAGSDGVQQQHVELRPVGSSGRGSLSLRLPELELATSEGGSPPAGELAGVGRALMPAPSRQEGDAGGRTGTDSSDVEPATTTPPLAPLPPPSSHTKAKASPVPSAVDLRNMKIPVGKDWSSAPDLELGGSLTKHRRHTTSGSMD